MPRLWQKVQAEMRPGSRLISNTFAIPGVPAQRVIEPYLRDALIFYLIAVGNLDFLV